jgi:hypothetical protein
MQGFESLARTGHVTRATVAEKSIQQATENAVLRLVSRPISIRSLNGYIHWQQHRARRRAPAQMV